MPSPDLYYDLLSDDNAEHIRDFDCGSESWEADLNEFIKNDALRDQSLNLSRTYLFFIDHQPRLCGFVTLLTGTVERREWSLLPQTVTYKFIPALLIGRLAVRKELQGQQIGNLILAWVRDLATQLPIGCRLLAVQVDKDNRDAIRFYEREGFVAAPVKGGKNLQTMLYDLLIWPEQGQ